MLTEFTVGLSFYRLSLGAYVNELVPQGDRVAIMIYTGYEDAAEYLVRCQTGKATVTTPYAPFSLSAEFDCEGSQQFEVVEMKTGQNWDYAVVPVSYVVRFGIPRERYAIVEQDLRMLRASVKCVRTQRL